MNKKVSVVIPTLLKNKTFLEKLIAGLEKDRAVEEIIVINNSGSGVILPTGKIKIITPGTNIFVNPAWNLGVKEAECDIVALLNDDIIIPENFCSNVVSQMKPEMGIVGFDGNFVTDCKKEESIPGNAEMFLEEKDLISYNFGIAMFFCKSAYTEIPEEIKVFFGDNWIFYKARQSGKINYHISGQQIYHYHGMSSSSFARSPLYKNDKKYFRKYYYTLFQRLFGIEYFFGYTQYRFFGIKFTKHTVKSKWKQ